MNITDFSKKTGIGTDSLRHYDRLGLLSPTRQENGYRNYTDKQLETAAQIRALRDLDVPLEEIALLLQGSISNAALLEQHEARLLTRFVAQRKALTTLQGLLRGKRRNNTLEVQEMILPASHILSIRALVTWDDIATFRTETTLEFQTLLESQKAIAVNQPIVLQHNLDFVVDQLDLEVLIPVSKALHGNGRIRAGQMPQIRLIFTKNTQKANNALPVYKKLFQHLENQGFRTGIAVWLEGSSSIGFEILEAS